MAYVACYSSPNSFQLRRYSSRRRVSGFSCDRSSSVIFRRSFRPVLSFSAAGDVGNGESAVVPDRSWIDSESAPQDSFAGWFSKDSSSQKPKFRGIVAAGVAGVILAAGVTFASLSLGKRSLSGSKEPLEPLTTQQEVILESDGQNERVDEVGNQNDGDHTSPAGINQDSFLSLELTEATSESSPGDNVHADTSLQQTVEPEEPKSGLIESSNDIDYASSKEDFKVSSGVDGSSVASDSPEVSSMLDLATEPREDFGIAYPDNMFITETDSLDLDTQEDIIVSVEIENSHPPHFSSHSDNPLLGNPLASESRVPLGSDVTEDSQLECEVIVETVTSDSSEKGPNPSEASWFPSEGTSAPLEVHTSNGNGLFETASTSVVVDIYGNELDANSHSEIDRTKSLSESPRPGNIFSYAGVPAPSTVSAALQFAPGKVLVPAVVDQVQGQALAALQVLKVIEADVQPSDLCTRRQYARWLVSASSALSRNSTSKVYPAMYIEKVTELAFDDITPDDRDFASIQGLAEAGLISSKLSRRDMFHSLDGDLDGFNFSPESPLSRQDLVSWKMALEKRHLLEVDRKVLSQCTGFLDIDRVDPDAWPALAADFSAGEQGITALAFGYTRLFQPDKPVTNAQAAIALATGVASEVVGEELARIEAESMADTAVTAHNALVAQVEKDLNARFEEQLAMEREKIDAVEKIAEEARLELERLKTEREEENNSLVRGHAAVESEMEILSKLRMEVEQQLQGFMSSKMEISFERDRLNKLRKEAESENQVVAQLKYELEVERKALSMARAWAEDEAKRAREHAKSLEDARDRWQRHGIKVVVDSELRDETEAGITWLNAGKISPTKETINRAENTLEKLKVMAGEIKMNSSAAIERLIQKIGVMVSYLKQQVAEASVNTREFCRVTVEDIQRKSAGFSSIVQDGAKKLVGDCRDGMEKITHKFKA